MQQTEKKGLEYALGKGLMQPFANTNSGSRKLMYSVHLEQALRLLNPEVPIISTGYEIRFGDISSSIMRAKSDIEVIAMISKFQNNPRHHYQIITKNLETGEYDAIERKSYNHITETYGYLYNNTILDNLDIGYEVPKNEILRSSYANDQYNNRCDGVNLMVGYISSDKNMEDGIVISESAAKKLASPLIKKVTLFLGENDILLNLYGKDGNFKSLPDIGEEVEGGLLCAIRTEKIEECLYMQSIERLKTPLMSDKLYPVEGKVIDVNIHSNNPEILEERHTNCQILNYYQEHMRYVNEIVSVVDSLRDENGNIKMSYELQKLYWTCRYELEGRLFERDKKYNGTIVEIYILEENIPSVGDKITNRYGGKGVISYIVPDENMPLLDNGERLEIYFNSCTCINRLNQGQLNELSLTFIGSRLLEYIETHIISTNDAISMICDFISCSAPDEGRMLYEKLYAPGVSEEDREWFVDDTINSKSILLSIKPVSESMTLDKLNEIYKKFPFIQPYRTMSKMTDSTGNDRWVKGRRTIVAGKMYIYRLKQYAEDKFSATSLSSTNLTNENTKSKASKNYMATCSNTPIRFGEMEAEDMRHMGTEVVVHNLMIHSSSPQARRLAESMIEADPYNIDIRLDGTCKSRSAEKAKVYLKAMGYAIKFFRIPKQKKRLFSIPTPKALPGEVQTLFSHDHPDENHGSGEEWLKKLKAKEKARHKRLFRKRLFSDVIKEEDGTDRDKE